MWRFATAPCFQWKQHVLKHMEGIDDDLFENLMPLQTVQEHLPPLQPDEEPKPGTPTPKRRKKEKHVRREWDPLPESLKD